MSTATSSDVPRPRGSTPNKQLMQEAFPAIKGNWPTAFFFSLLPMPGYLLLWLYRLFSNASPWLSTDIHAFSVDIFGLINTLWFILSYLWCTLYFRCLMEDGPPSIFETFSRTPSSLQIVGLFFVFWLLRVVFNLCIFLLLFGTGLFPLPQNPTPTSALLVLGFASGIGLFRLWLAISFFPLYYRFGEIPRLGAWDAIFTSWKLMSGKRWKLFCLGCRFLGWFLLCIVTFGIALLWVLPYFNAALAAFYNDLYTRTEQPVQSSA